MKLRSNFQSLICIYQSQMRNMDIMDIWYLQGYYLLSLGGFNLSVVPDGLGFSMLKRSKLLNYHIQ